MSSTDDQCPACGQTTLVSGAARPVRGFWPSIVRIAIIEIVVLAALAGLFVAYLEWSSEASFSEFLAATQSLPASGLPVSEIHAPCKRDGA